MNPLTGIVAIPLALFSALLLFARPAHAPDRDLNQQGLLLLPSAKWHIASPEVTKLLKGAYPATVATLAGKWSTVFDVPVSWIRSQAYAESRNVLTALNDVTGAAGVMQVLPKTADWLVESLRKSVFYENPQVRKTMDVGLTGEAENLFNPDVNIMLAAYYMLVLKRKFGKDHDVVAAAYNIGPNRIAECIRQRRPFPTASRIYIAMVKDAKRRGFV